MARKILTTSSVFLLVALAVEGRFREGRPEDDRPSNPKRHHRHQCSGDADPGPCMAYMERWFFNSASGQCETFVFGGCHGNGNRFHTKEECESKCQGPCSLEPETGPCRARKTKWFFNATSGQCETFMYGGCRGNANRFPTEKRCNTKCSGRLNPKPVCSPVRCRMACPNGYMKDENGCDICQCQRIVSDDVENSCSPKRCRMDCPNGYMKDDNGCEICQCQRITSDTVEKFCSPKRCRMDCPNGYMKDDNGCEICKCQRIASDDVENSCSPKRCRMACPNGYMKDDNGCEICQCRESVNSEETPCNRVPMCLIECPFGHVLDHNGCKTCHCLPNPKEEEKQETEDDDEETEDDDEEDKSGDVEAKCSPIRCRMACPGGYVKDSDGCNLCRCKRPWTFIQQRVSQQRRGSKGRKPCRPPVCFRACPYGSILDLNGCETCRCIRHHV